MNDLIKVLNWISGGVLIFFGMALLFGLEAKYSGSCFIFSGCLLFPPIRQFVFKQTGKELPLLVRCLTIIILLSIGLAPIDKEPEIDRASMSEQEIKEMTIYILSEIRRLPSHEYEKLKKAYRKLTILEPENQIYKDQFELYEAKWERFKLLNASFNPWNGAHRGLEYMIKDSMNDPDSYKHAETKFHADGDDYLIVTTRFRGRNVFGGIVLQTLTAKVDLYGNVLEILSGGDNLTP